MADVSGRGRRAPRWVIWACLGWGWWAISCRDISTPADGIFQLSPARLPLPGIVAGDTMRDSTGLVAPIRIIAFDIKGDTIANAPVTFVAIDTGAHFVGPLLIGDVAGKSVRIVGSSSALQTQPVIVKITVSPDTLVAADSVLHHATFKTSTGDTVSNSAELATVVQHTPATTPVGVEAVIVRYTIVQAPASNGNGPSLVLLNGSIVSDRDTSDATGRASRIARLRITAASNTDADTAVIDATASYRGHPIGTVQFTVIFTKK